MISNGNSKETRIKNLAPMKAILMLSIVLLHSMRVFGGGWGPCEPKTPAPVYGYIAEWLGSFAVAAFTLISGYLFCYIKYEKGGYEKYLPLILNKAKRLLVPYVFISAIYVIPIHILLFGTEDLLVSFALGQAPEHLWFLLMLFGVFALFALITDFMYRHPVWGGVIICVLVCASMVLPNYFQIATALRYSAFFYIGFILFKSDRVSNLLFRIPSVIYIVVDLLFFAATKVIRGDGMIFKLLGIGLTFLLNIFGAVSAFIVLQKLFEKHLSDNRGLAFFAKHSMTIYLMHQPIIFLTIKFLNETMPPTVIVILSFVLSLGLSTAFSVLMYKTKVTRFLIGCK